MKHIRTGLFTFLMLTALLFAGAATLAHADQQYVTGILSATGYDSPAWEVKLDEPVVLGNKVYGSIEVFAEGEDLSPLSGKHVSASGTFVQWRTPERGKFIVLHVCEIVQTRH